MNARQSAFVREYLLDFNATRAYICAGYSPDGASNGAGKLMAHPIVRGHIERGKASRAARAAVTADQVLAETSLLANSDVSHYIVTDEGQVTLAPGAPEGAMRAIQAIKRKTRVILGKDGEAIAREYDVELRLWDKVQPLRLMGRHVNLFAEKVDVSVRAIAAGLTDAQLDAEIAALDEKDRAARAGFAAPDFLEGVVVPGPAPVEAREREGA